MYRLVLGCKAVCDGINSTLAVADAVAANREQVALLTARVQPILIQSRLSIFSANLAPKPLSRPAFDLIWPFVRDAGPRHGRGVGCFTRCPDNLRARWFGKALIAAQEAVSCTPSRSARELENALRAGCQAILAQPATKIFLRKTEPRAAKWTREAVEEVKVERLRSTHRMRLSASSDREMLFRYDKTERGGSRRTFWPRLITIGAESTPDKLIVNTVCS